MARSLCCCQFCEEKNHVVFSYSSDKFCNKSCVLKVQDYHIRFQYSCFPLLYNKVEIEAKYGNSIRHYVNI